MAMVQIQSQQEFDVQLTGIKDARGHDATFDGPPIWESSDEGIASITVAEDGLSAVVSSADTEGAVTITVTGDGRVGPDVATVVGTLSVVVAAGDVVAFELTAGEVRDRAEPA